ncbi:MAG: flagellar basal body rod protein FlgB [Nitrospinota bacterium]|nr:flagellar basal body rod protein FlgB [Nitrospinota bacterium]
MLIDKLLFSDRAPKLLKKSLNSIADRHLLVSGNISNVDTPGYKAHDMDFQKDLRNAVGGGDRMQMKTTNAKHIGPSANGLDQFQPEIFEEENAARANGNNVDMDKEMGKMAEIQILYQAIAQLMTKRGSTVKAAVTEQAVQ